MWEVLHLQIRSRLVAVNRHCPHTAFLAKEKIVPHTFQAQDLSAVLNGGNQITHRKTNKRTETNCTGHSGMFNLRQLRESLACGGLRKNYAKPIAGAISLIF